MLLSTCIKDTSPQVWHLNLTATSIGIYKNNVANTLSRIYLMPRIFCLRVNLIQALDLLHEDSTQISQIFIQATLGNLTFTSKLAKNHNGNPKCYEDMLIDMLEPFNQLLNLNMKKGMLGSYKNLGTCVFPVKNGDKRVDESLPSTKIIDVKQNEGFAGRHDLRLSLDGEYHVFDEDPHWNEQYSWDSYDPCTFIRNCRSDNGQLHKGDALAIGTIDTRIGNVMVTLSEPETIRIHSYSDPIVELQPLGLKKTGEIQLAFNFCYTDMINLCKVVYTLPMPPRQHFVNPLHLAQYHGLRKQVVMLDSVSGEIMWNMQRGKAEFETLKTFESGLVTLCTQLGAICKRNPISSLIICLFLIIVMIVSPQHLLSTMFSCVIMRVLLQHQNKPRKECHVGLQMFHVDTASINELKAIIRDRYDRLRVVAEKYVTVLVDFATKGERLQCLIIWQDPIATILIMVLCLVTGIVALIVPFQSIVSVWLLYLLRHPILCSFVPTLHESWIRSMPSKLDSMIMGLIVRDLKQ
uniref:Uncharacterized protein n=2 Tax=Cajanus cajan TaxID=3821 RepID=A0A151U2N7_CAJCA|nr:hypothetical protein KK1_006151 [Cajanus cajan]